MTERRELVHGTCVALGPHGALLRGGSRSGKSDLALRFLALGAEQDLQPRLVADLVSAEEVPRMPPHPCSRITLAGVALPVVKLAPFELSAPLKLKLALLSAVSQSPHQQDRFGLAPSRRRDKDSGL